MLKREPLLSDVYFDEAIAFYKNTLERDETALATAPEQFAKPAVIARYIFSRRQVLLMAEYSRGYTLEALRSTFPRIIEAWEQLHAIDVDGAFPGAFTSSLDHYVRALWLLSQAYLLGVEPAILQRTLACIGNESQDLLFERLVTRLLPDVPRKPAKKLLYPKAYQPLYDALDAPAAEQATLMQQFVKNWYKRMSKAAWYNNHKGPEGGGFFGYWCWEAAGVTVTFGIDDSSFRDLPYYPKDLADFARTPG
jgi:hypothetical protein